jgi:hypothetical protein
MREIAEIELAIQGGTEKIEQLGEKGEADEAMREMAAIEALKSEKSEKEVSYSASRRRILDLIVLFSASSKTLRTLRERLATRNCVCATFVAPTCLSSTPIDVSPTISVERFVSLNSASPSEIMLIDSPLNL